QHFADEDALCRHVAELIAQEKIVGWVQGRMEFGPRALGCRSILGDPRSQEMQSRMNLKTKFRESFRPFAPSVLQEQAHGYFQMPPEVESPYMMLVADVQDDKRVPSNGESPRGLDMLKTRRSVIPAVTHVDYSARLQTVDHERHRRYYKLIRAFEAQTGCP